MTVRTEIAKSIFQHRGTWSAERADEYFAAYNDNPKSLEPEIMDEVADAYRDATLAVEECAKVADACHERDDIDNGAAATGAAKAVADLLRADGEALNTKEG